MSTLTRPRIDVPADAVLDRLRTLSQQWTPVATGTADRHPVVVRGTHTPTRHGPVVVALDDDDNAGPLLRHGHEVATRLGVALRVVHVWSDCRPPDCPHHRRCHRDLDEADRLLAALLDEHLPTATAPPIEREVLHEPDCAEALIALTASASTLVIGSSSDRPTRSTGHHHPGHPRPDPVPRTRSAVSPADRYQDPLVMRVKQGTKGVVQGPTCRPT